MTISLDEYPLSLVLDCSVTMAWCFEDEATKYTEAILTSLHNTSAAVPTIWSWEIGNVLAIAERKKRLTGIQSNNFVEALKEMPILIDSNSTNRAWSSVLQLAKKQTLTVYDAAYLELAIRKDLPLATLDKALRNAATKLKIKIF